MVEHDYYVKSASVDERRVPSSEMPWSVYGRVTISASPYASLLGPNSQRDTLYTPDTVQRAGGPVSHDPVKPSNVLSYL